MFWDAPAWGENSVDNSQTILYTYDGSGNIENKKIYAYTTEENLDSLSFKFIDYTYDDEDWGDLLIAYNGEAITYDKIGNPLKYRSGMKFQWDVTKRNKKASQIQFFESEMLLFYLIFKTSHHRRAL